MRAAIYTRISDDDGTAKGVARQEADCREEIERRGWDVVGVYTDNDVSATRSKVRPSYQRMLADVQAGHVQAVVVWDIDRLTRTPREIEDVIDLAEQTGVALVNVTGQGDVGTDDGRMILRIKASIARREVEQMSKRLRRKLQDKATAGEPHGQASYGYRRDGGADVIVPTEADAIREAARRVLAGESLRRVAADFQARGVPSPSVSAASKRVKPPDVMPTTPWQAATLRQVIRRPSVAGLRQYQGTVVGQSAAEPILDEGTHLRLAALFADPARRDNYAGRAPKYLLSGIALCGREGCSGSMRRSVGHTNTLASGAKKRQPSAYVCSTCYRVRRRQELVDDLVESVVVARLSQPDIGPALFTIGDPDAAREVRDRIDAIDAKLATAADQFADDTITGGQLSRITAKLRADRTLHEVALRGMTPTTGLVHFTHGDVAAKWRAAPIEQKRLVLEAIMTVTILPSGPGRSFDPDLVQIVWRSAA